jgi:hypothetical protein
VGGRIFSAAREGRATPEETLQVIHQLVGPLPPAYQVHLTNEPEYTESEAVRKC